MPKKIYSCVWTIILAICIALIYKISVEFIGNELRDYKRVFC